MRRLPTILALAAACAGGAERDWRRPKKLIATGWDKADSQRLRQNLELMEQRPFDGVIMGIVGRVDEKRRCPLRAAFQDAQWQREWFLPAVRNLQACTFRRFTDNFVTVGANPGDVDWFDDRGWANVVDHWRIAAWAAREAGFAGILFDPEPYTPPHAQFRYAAQPGRDAHPFADYYAQARRRGRQVMEAIAEEYPDITLFCYFMNSACSAACGHPDPRTVLAAHGYGLLPAFIDGWLDAAPPDATFVDGCERAYLFNSVEQYLEAAVLIKGACQELVAPENRAKYRAQVQVGFGVYLDAYWNPKDSEWGRWYIDGKGGPRIDRLRANVATALRVADQYVWTYGEKFRWWPTPNSRVREQTWPQALPGCEDILRFARDPQAYARAYMARLREAGELVNLARNGDFASPTASPNERPADDWDPRGAPAGWHTWQAADSHGTFGWDRAAGASAEGSARAAGVANGCFIQKHPAEPGQRCAVQAFRRVQGRGRAWVRVRWQTAEGAWTAQARDAMVHAQAPRERWGECFGVVEVPEAAGQLVLLLCVGGQASPRDVAWFDDVALIRLP
ncbi:MAG: hypothetical protein ACLF0G_16300 [Candidatus Brocadiia bacterium]